ncbi:MAG: hypothetical protein LAT63_11485 [Marinobacter sp.]|nr:hypothetical protein [Marinobacter sp.]
MNNFKWLAFTLIFCVSLGLLSLFFAYKSPLARFIIADYFFDDGSKVLAIGSSTISLVPEEYFVACGQLRRRGIGNSTIDDAIRYVNLAPRSNDISRVFVYVGENDIHYGQDVDFVLSRLLVLIEGLLKKYPDGVVHLIALKLSPARSESHESFLSFNQRVKYHTLMFNEGRVVFESHFLGIAEDKHYFLDDMVHLNEYGYSTVFSFVEHRCQK